MDLGDSFYRLFSSPSILVLGLWTVGFVLFSIEYFQPMRGLMYVLGGTLVIAAFITRMLYGSAGEAFAFVLVTAVFMLVMHAASIATQKRHWLRAARSAPTAHIERLGERDRSRSALVRNSDALVGRTGVANTQIFHTGNVTVDDVNLVVTSETPIPTGARIKIVRVTADKIIVERIDSTTQL